MRRILSLCVLLLGVGCIATAGFLFWQTQQEEQVALSTSQSVADLFTQQVTLAHTDTVSITTPTIGASDQTAETVQTPSIEIDGEGYMGLLSIPALDLTLPVSSTWSDAKLLSTPCAFGGSLLDDTLIIAAHNYKAHFGTINQLAFGDQVTLLDATGTLHSYVLVGQEVIDENDLTGLCAGTWDLTLFTCLYGDNTQRVVLRFCVAT